MQHVRFFVHRSRPLLQMSFKLERKLENLCNDYRQLNDRTVKDSYALPRIEEMFDCLHGALSRTIDQKSGYHRVEIEEFDKDRT